MTLGFGNNVVSALASEITASQKTIPVMPGSGAKFAELLTQDNANSSAALNMFAKITLTDAGETEFEICHLLSVSGDVLTVVRGQEKTDAKGWMLNDVVANFATRGSENQFVQIEHLQSGFYCAGVAGGSANALTLNLPASFFLNGATDWILRTPVIVYPTQNNTGAATLQLTMGGKVLGTFPLYKGDKKQLAAKDILKDVALVCLLDNSKTFFNVSNPGAIYAGLGTAAYRDVQTSRDDTTAGRVLANGGAIAVRSFIAKGEAGGDATDANDLPQNSVSFVYASAAHSPGFESSILDFSGLDGRYNVQLAASYSQPGLFKFRTRNGDSDIWSSWDTFYTTAHKQTAAETGALPLSQNALTADLNTLGAYSAAGIYYQSGNAGATAANHYPAAEAGTLEVTPGAYGCQQEYTTFSSHRKFVRGLTSAWNGTNGPWSDWVEFYSQNNPNEIVSSSPDSFRMVNGNHGTFWRQDGANLYLMLTNPGDPYGNYNDFRPFYVDLATGYPIMGRLSLSDYTNFDARYATSDWVYANFSTAVRLGAQYTHPSTNDSGGTIQLGNGEVFCGAAGVGGSDFNKAIWYVRPIQYYVNGQWVQAGSV